MQTITIGMEVGKFRLVEQIGIGSAGEVWRATNGRQSVAVKYLNTTLLARDDRDLHLRRFHNEAIALKKVSDLVHIPTHFHHDLKIERPYIVMEFIESRSYLELMQSGEMMYVPLPDRLTALQRLAETLHVVHSRGILHRDIKPGNIYGIEKPYLMDFSIGMPMTQSESANRRVGTPLYMPPDLLPPSARTDNYAFAIVTYEVIFGRHPLFDYRNVPEDADDLRKSAARAILDETWYRPNKLDETALPVNLQGADLDKLTSIFQNALMLTDDRYANIEVFMQDVLDAIHIPQNAPYIDKVPIPTDDVGGEQFEGVQDFTDHLVEAYSASTDLPPEVTGDINERHWILGLTALFVIIFLVVVVLALTPTG